MPGAPAPVTILIPWASSASSTYVTSPMPIPSQQPNPRASYTDGFPPLTFTALTAGGIPPDGRDFNDLGKATTSWNRWQAAGGPAFFDGTFSTLIGGYPKQAKLDSSVTPGLVWVSTVDNNTTDPDGGSPVGWQALGLTKASTGTVVTGTDDSEYVTSLGVHAAIEALLPNAATEAEALALTNATHYITPATLGDVLALRPFIVSQTMVSGFLVTEWSTGIIEQCGFVAQTTGLTTESFTFPVPFPNSLISLVPGATLGGGFNLLVDLKTVSRLGFTYAIYTPGDGAGPVAGFYIEAKGK